MISSKNSVKLTVGYVLKNQKIDYSDHKKNNITKVTEVTQLISVVRNKNETIIR